MTNLIARSLNADFFVLEDPPLGTCRFKGLGVTRALSPVIGLAIREFQNCEPEFEN